MIDHIKLDQLYHDKPLQCDIVPRTWHAQSLQLKELGAKGSPPVRRTVREVPLIKSAGSSFDQLEYPFVESTRRRAAGALGELDTIQFSVQMSCLANPKPMFKRK